MNNSWPETLKTIVDEQVSQRGYGTSGEYVRELIRKDQDHQELPGLLMAGGASTPTALADSEYFRCATRPCAQRRAVKAKPVIPRALEAGCR